MATEEVQVPVEEVPTGEGGAVRLGKRCFVGNLAWRTSWQDLKVSRGAAACAGAGCIAGGHSHLLQPKVGPVTAHALTTQPPPRALSHRTSSGRLAPWSTPM
jgi:hypothetical protein